MIAVKDQIFSALAGLADLVSDSFPEEFAQGTSIVYFELDNSVKEYTDDAEQLAHLAYSVDIYRSDGSTTKAACDVDEALSALGLVRVECHDVAENSKWRHKHMQYEGYVDVHTEHVFHPNTY